MLRSSDSTEFSTGRKSNSTSEQRKIKKKEAEEGRNSHSVLKQKERRGRQEWKQHGKKTKTSERTENQQKNLLGVKRIDQFSMSWASGERSGKINYM